MASAKEYGYFIKGNKFALIEKDTALDNDVNSRDYGPDATGTRFKSPLSSVADGIELEYIYSPKYFINQTTDTNIKIDQYAANSDGLLYVKAVASTDNFGASPESLATGSYIVLRGAGQFNGLHKVKTLMTTVATNDTIVFYTRYTGSSSFVGFERTVTLYYNINVLSDESDELPISEYLSKAVVYYMKAKTAEDKGNFQLQQQMMKEFYRIVEKSDNSKIHTIRKVAVHSAAIR